MAGFISTRALNNVIKLGVAGIALGSVVNSTLYNGELAPSAASALHSVNDS